MSCPHEIPTIDGVKITPELAAVVVKDYLLPMFERDEKMYLKKKTGHNTSGSIEDVELNYTNPPKTIYAELKLTETLLAKLESLKAEQAITKEINIKLNEECLSAKQELYQIKATFADILKEKQNYNKIVDNLTSVTDKMKSENTQLLERVGKLEKELGNIETDKIELKHKLELEHSKNELLMNEIEAIKQNNSMQKIQCEVIGDKLVNTQESLQQQIVSLKSEYDKCKTTSMLVEADRDNINKDREKVVNSLKANLSNLEEEREKLKMEIDSLSNEKNNLDKEKKELKDKMAKKIEQLQLLRHKKGGEKGAKICMNCNKEYLEKENQIDSCVRHRVFL